MNKELAEELYQRGRSVRHDLWRVNCQLKELAEMKHPRELAMQLDHIIFSSRSKNEAAAKLREILPPNIHISGVQVQLFCLFIHVTFLATCLYH
jgi:hypothetical protein